MDLKILPFSRSKGGGGRSPGGEGEGKERGRERDRLSYNSILLVKPKEEKRSNKTRPIFGKEVTGKETGLQRAALGGQGIARKHQLF